MSPETLGNLAALVASLTWAFSVLGFQEPLARHGPFACNLSKLILGSLLFLTTSLLLGDLAQVGSAQAGPLAMLALSGIIGMALGDFCFFGAMRALGPRRASLLHATAPFFLFFHALLTGRERPDLQETLGVVLVVAGVMDVILLQERRDPSGRERLLAGILFGLGSAGSQSAGILISKSALAEVPLVLASGVRLSAGCSATILAALLIGARGRLRALRERRLWTGVFGPVLVGTYLGVLLMLMSIRHGKPAVAGALLSLTPIFLVPLVAWRSRERLDWRLLLGIAVAVVGVVLIGR